MNNNFEEWTIRRLAVLHCTHDGLDRSSLPVLSSSADAPHAALHRDGDDWRGAPWRPHQASRLDCAEQPVALQLGGSDPSALAQCARIGEEFGYREINLNVGCPSGPRAGGPLGACLMAEPALVGDCVAAMKAGSQSR